MYPQQSSSMFQSQLSQLWVTTALPERFTNEKELFYKKNDKMKKKKLSLLGSFIKFREDKYIDVNQAMLEYLTDPVNDQPGIRLTKNNQSIEIFGEIEEWCQLIKKYVIQTNFSRRYKLLQKLGHGSTGTVYKLKSRFYNTYHAGKIINKNILINRGKEYKQLLKEIEILKIIQHPNLVQFQELFETQEHVVVIFEYLSGGELQDLILDNNLKEPDVKKLVYSIIKGVNYLHEKGIFHRDLKPQNILLRDASDFETCCLVDFGLADYWNLQGDYNYTRCGTPGFVAPELLQDKKYTLQIDVYSIGIIMFLLLTKKLPFDGLNEEELIIKNFYGILDFSYFQQSQLCLDVIKQMLRDDFNRRITCTQLLLHPFFQQTNKIQNSFKIRLSNMKCTLNNKNSPTSASALKSSLSNLDSSTQSNDYSPTVTLSPSPYMLSNKLSPLSSPRKRLQQPQQSKFRNQKVQV